MVVEIATSQEGLEVTRSKGPMKNHACQKPNMHGSRPQLRLDLAADENLRAALRALETYQASIEKVALVT